MCSFRETLKHRIHLALAKAENENSARTLAETQRLDIEKEKTIMELELKESINILKADNLKKDLKINTVSC